MGEREKIARRQQCECFCKTWQSIKKKKQSRKRNIYTRRWRYNAGVFGIMQKRLNHRLIYVNPTENISKNVVVVIIALYVQISEKNYFFGYTKLNKLFSLLVGVFRNFYFYFYFGRIETENTREL